MKKYRLAKKIERNDYTAITFYFGLLVIIDQYKVYAIAEHAQIISAIPR